MFSFTVDRTEMAKGPDVAHNHKMPRSDLEVEAAMTIKVTNVETAKLKNTKLSRMPTKRSTISLVSNPKTDSTAFGKRASLSATTQVGHEHAEAQILTLIQIWMGAQEYVQM